MNLTEKLSEEEQRIARLRLKSISPNDGKYAKDSQKLVPYLSAEAEWRAFALVQRALLATRVEFGLAEQRHLDEIDKAIEKFDPLNAALLEEGPVKHDQLAVLDELGNHMSEETKALLHPGTTSYDIVDTTRAHLFKGAWKDVVRPKVAEVLEKLCYLAEENSNVLQTGRTHLQRTSPVPFMTTLALYAARIANRTEKCDDAFGDLRGKVSGIVGTGASIDAVIGEGKSLEFEEKVLAKFGLKPDYTATQVTQKERLCDVGNGIVTLMRVLGDFANDMRILYSSEINEVTSRDAAKRLGGSSADAGKNNPINWENIAGKVAVVESGMRVLYEMIQTDLQRDLRSSVQGRYQPHQMIAETYESFCRASRALDQLSVNRDIMRQHLHVVQTFPSEAMVAILRGHGYVHPKHGVGHEAVKEFSKVAKRENQPLIAVALDDEHFKGFYNGLTQKERDILDGRLEFYLGSSLDRARLNMEYARKVAGG